MKQRPSIVVFAGSKVSSIAEIYKTQLEGRAEIVSCVSLRGDEDPSNANHAIEVALRLFTAEALDGLVAKGLLDKVEIRHVPVLVVVHHSEASEVRKVAAALIESACEYANLEVKLRFTTLVLSEADLRAAREIGNLLVSALDGLNTKDGVAFHNTVLLVCKETRGAPVSESSLASILTRVALVLTTFDYDSEQSAFSDFWNAKIGGGGQTYFVGLVAYKLTGVESSAASLLYREAGTRLLEILRGNPVSMLPDMRFDVLAACVSNSMGNIDTGIGFVNGSEKWIKLADRYRKFVVPALLRELLPNVRSIAELRFAIEAIQEHVRPKSSDQLATTLAVIPLGAALLATKITAWLLPCLALAAVAGAGVLWNVWHKQPPPPPPQPPPPPATLIPESPVFTAVLDELLERLSQPQTARSIEETTHTDNWTGQATDLARSDCREKLPFCEYVIDCDNSDRGGAAARNAVCDAATDATRLLLMTKLQGGKWLSSEMLAEMNALHGRAIQKIGDEMVADFIEQAICRENERRSSGSIQDVLFAPMLQIGQFDCFSFFGSGLKPLGTTSETCAVRNTINFLYLAE